MENSVEFRYIFILILFLGVRIYYRVKLLILRSVVFSYSLVEKRYIGIVSVILITIVMIIFINVFIRLVFRLRFEIISFKISIYLFVLVFLCIRLLTNLNFKIFSYEKIKNFKEIWVLSVYELDKFIFSSIFYLIQFIRALNNVKLIMLINWWVMILFVYFF